MAHVKQMYEPVWPKRLALGSLGVPDHSVLMFQPKVGTCCCTRRSAPVKSSVATGSTANTLSWVSSPWTSLLLLASLSSRLAARTSLRP